MANEINMQVPMAGIVVGTVHRAAGTNRKTGEVIEETNQVHLLAPQELTAAVSIIKCSAEALEHFQKGALDFTNLTTAKVTKLMVHMRSYEVNGNKGITLRLIESKP